MRFSKLVASLAIVLCAITLVYAQSKDTPKTLTHLVFAPYWTAEPGWHSMFLLRNNMPNTPLVVTPLVRLAGGQEVSLAPVTISGDDVVNIDVGEQLQQATPPVSIQAGTYGSVVFQFDGFSHRNLYAAVMVHAEGEPIGYHIDAFGSDEEDYVWAREGVWWLPRSTVRDNLVIANASDKPNQGLLTIYDASGKFTRQAVQLSPRQTLRFSIGDLVKSAGLTGTYGGFTFQIAERSGSVDTVHFLYDETSGFSALMKMFDHDLAVKPEERAFLGNSAWTTWAPMLALQTPDRALALPKDVQLQPQILLRNTTLKPQTAYVTLTWRGDSGTGTFGLQPIQLRSFQTQLIDVAALQQKGKIPLDAHWALVEISSSTARPDDIMAVAASYDSTGRYGAQTPFSDQLADHWVAGEFEVDATHNSLIAISNVGNKPASTQITFHYNHGQSHYEMLKTIPPGDQLWLNMADIIRGAVPDKNGTTFPLDLNSATYDIRQLKAVSHPTIFEGKIIVDKTNGHLAYGCVSCCGYTSVAMVPSSITDVVGNHVLDAVVAQNACSAPPPEDVTGSAYNWVTTNPSVATMSANLVTLVGPGSTNGSAQVDLLWGNRLKTCPTQPHIASQSISSRVPTSSRVQTTLVNFALTSGAGCPSGQNGWYRQVQKTVTDQNGVLRKNLNGP